jgi:hypothetical protein
MILDRYFMVLFHKKKVRFAGINIFNEKNQNCPDVKKPPVNYETTPAAIQ